MASRLGTILCVPVKLDDTFNGLIWTGNTNETKSFGSSTTSEILEYALKFSSRAPRTVPHLIEVGLKINEPTSTPRRDFDNHVIPLTKLLKSIFIWIQIFS